MSGDERDRMAEVLNAEGLAQGGDLHGWRCGEPDRYGPCTCVAEVADALLAAGFGDVATRDAALAVAIEERDAARIERDELARKVAAFQEYAAQSVDREAERQALRRQVDAVRALHSPGDGWLGWCDTCERNAPCPTARALDAE